MAAVAGLVLTGGRSRRLGVDKATLLLDGERLADRAVRALRAVADPVLELGPGYTDAPAVPDDAPGRGPLAALASGGAALRAGGADPTPALALAVDLPRVDVRILGWLASYESDASVVPVVDDVAQTLCARYTSDALEIARELVEAGERSVRALLDAVPVERVDARDWGAIADASTFADVDTADDAAAFGIEVPR